MTTADSPNLAKGRARGVRRARVLPPLKLELEAGYEHLVHLMQREGWLTTREAKHALGCSASQVVAMIKSDMLTAFPLKETEDSPGHYRISPNSVLTYIAQHLLPAHDFTAPLKVSFHLVWSLLTCLNLSALMAVQRRCNELVAFMRARSRSVPSEEQIDVLCTAAAQQHAVRTAPKPAPALKQTTLL